MNLASQHHLALILANIDIASKLHLYHFVTGLLESCGYLLRYYTSKSG